MPQGLLPRGKQTCSTSKNPGQAVLLIFFFLPLAKRAFRGVEHGETIYNKLCYYPYLNTLGEEEEEEKIESIQTGGRKWAIAVSVLRALRSFSFIIRHLQRELCNTFSGMINLRKSSVWLSSRRITEKHINSPHHLSF